VLPKVELQYFGWILALEVDGIIVVHLPEEKEDDITKKNEHHSVDECTRAHSRDGKEMERRRVGTSWQNQPLYSSAEQPPQQDFHCQNDNGHNDGDGNVWHRKTSFSSMLPR
jgi:hypothetical protein